MADNSHIEWTDATWNPITGCSVVSPGCTNCYAMRLAGTRLKHHPSRKGLTDASKAGPVWNGEVRFNEQWLNQPLRWRRPRRIFVCAHGDLFHENVPDEWIDKVFAVMALCPQHTFQVLTKRPERMRKYLNGCERPVAEIVANSGRKYGWQTRHDAAGQTLGFDGPCWPLPNVWLGVSVEDQTRADERIPVLLETPAACRFVSAEPLIGPVRLNDVGRPWITKEVDHPMDTALDWIIVGGESGPGARPMHPNWARSTRDQCQAAGVAFHFKQWGAWRHWVPGDGDAEIAHVSARDGKQFSEPAGVGQPGGPRVDTAAMACVGKKAAGRELDGRTWDEFPEMCA